MTKEKIQNKLVVILARLGHGEADFSLPFRMNKIDSLDVVELVMECENEFNITVPDLEIAECMNLNQLVELIASKIPEH